MSSKDRLRIWHDKYCPELDINSLDFTNFLIEEIAKLKAEFGG